MGDVTCLIYEAKDGGPVEDCTKPDINLCRDCTWPPPEVGEKPNCWAKKNFTRNFAEDYGYVSGVKEMKKEIWKRGPIGCGVDATAKFDAYTGGIFEQEASPGHQPRDLGGRVGERQGDGARVLGWSQFLGLLLGRVRLLQDGDVQAQSGNRAGLCMGHSQGLDGFFWLQKMKRNCGK